MSRPLFGHLIALLASIVIGSESLHADDALNEPVDIPTPDPQRDATVIAVEKVIPGVVNIATRTWVEREHPYERLWRQYYGYQRQPEASYSRGSGVVVNEDGYVLTNTHVVSGADDIWVQFFNES